MQPATQPDKHYTLGYDTTSSIWSWSINADGVLITIVFSFTFIINCHKNSEGSHATGFATRKNTLYNKHTSRFISRERWYFIFIATFFICKSISNAMSLTTKHFCKVIKIIDIHVFRMKNVEAGAAFLSQLIREREQKKQLIELPTCASSSAYFFLDAEANVTFTDEGAVRVLTHSVLTQVLLSQALVHIWI